MQKKRLVFFSFIILFGFSAAFIFLREKKNGPESIAPSPDIKKDSVITTTLLSTFFNMESSGDAFISTEQAFSGKKSCKLSPETEYGFSVNKLVKDIPSSENLKIITIHFKCRMEKTDAKALYVFTINDEKGKSVYWEGKPIVCDKKEDWSDVVLTFDVKSEFLKPGNTLILYPWNKEKKSFFIDDLQVNYIGTTAVNGSENLSATNTNFFFDFETITGLSNPETIKLTTAHSGKMACELTGGKEYGPSVIKKISDISQTPLKKISLSMWVYPLTDKANVVLTTSVSNSKNETVFWDGKSTENQSFPKNKWTKLNAAYVLPDEKIHPEDLINVNIWNKGKTDLIVDDLEIVYGESAERRGIPSTVDENSIYEKQFVPTKNKPPFKTIYFEKEEINNVNSTYITADKKDQTADFSPNDEFLIGNFAPDKNNLDEIICVKKGMTGLFAYSFEKKQFQLLWNNTNAADSVWNDNNSMYSANFNNDGKSDIVIVNKKNKAWTILDFDGKKWITLKQGKEKELDKKWIEKKDAVTYTTGIFKSSDVVFSGDYFGDNKNELLKFNSDWRFDLKLIEQDKNEFTILGNVDFKGYPDDHNPKYYEFVKIVSGKFTTSNQSSILIMMRNCMDSNFNGIHCNAFENLPFLPNSTQLYRMINK